MILDQKGNTSIITQEKLSILELINNIESVYSKIESNNIIVILSDLAELQQDNMAKLLELSMSHRSKKHSFVIVSNKIDFDDVSEDFVVTPTLQEALDIVEMEEMERDLGF